MAKIICFSIQKGGCGKTTTTGITAHLLSKKYKVLAVDMDSQGNLTELLTQRDIYDFHGNTILEAMKERDARKYIHKVSDNLHILTAEDHLSTFARYLYDNRDRFNLSTVLKQTLDAVRSDYDYIVIDTPPALGEQTINSLAASDSVVALFETSKFCYSALGRFLETVDHVINRVNNRLKVAGILRTLIDSKRTDNKLYIKKAAEDYGILCFNTIIKRQASIGRLPIEGFIDNPELSSALKQYHNFVEELLVRV